MAIEHKTAILLFTRTPQQEAAVKSFIPNSFKKNLAVAKRLLQYTQKEASQTSLPLFTIYSSHQKGNSFGERLSNEVEAIYSKGFDQVIIIGNDTPQLKRDLILDAQKLSNQDQIVIGPSTDGGTYLIALHKKHFSKAAFIDLDWESSQLQQSFIAYAATFQTSLVFTESFTDIDTTEDFFNVSKVLKEQHSLKKIFISILNSFFVHFFFSDDQIRLTTTKSFFNLRAPPFLKTDLI